jgi:hypothetical protein
MLYTAVGSRHTLLPPLPTGCVNDLQPILDTGELLTPGKGALGAARGS